jgi:hypothetical protein
MMQAAFRLDEASALLARTPLLLSAWLRDMPAAQIARAMAGRCAEVVGPWRAYLRVVRDAEKMRG